MIANSTSAAAAQAAALAEQVRAAMAEAPLALLDDVCAQISIAATESAAKAKADGAPGSRSLGRAHGRSSAVAKNSSRER